MNALANVVGTGTSAILPQNLSLRRATAEFERLTEWLMSQETQGLALHEIEKLQEERGREVMRLMLQAHLDARGVGDVGPHIHVADPESPSETSIHTHKRLHTIHPVSIFGEVELKRMGYGRRGGVSLHPLDHELQLPDRSFGYELQRRLVKAAVQGPFEEACERIEENTGVKIPKRSAEQMVLEAAQDFDAFYEQRRPPPCAQTGPILAAAIDGKGIPMVKQKPAERVARRAKGQKANKKRMATVASVYTQQPRIRTPEEVVESLFRTGPRPVVEGGDGSKRKWSRPEHKRVWASLIEGKQGVIREAAEEMNRRDPKREKIRVAITDGDRALQRRTLKGLAPAILVLDLPHALEKLWGAAYAFHPEGSQEAEEWVKERTLRILRGEVSQVVKGIRQSATKRKLRGGKREAVDAATKYLYRNRARMRYNEYLEQGLPIASGAVEGAGKNLIKDRMERSGMRWTEEMAEAMVKLRATYLSGDFDAYWAFHILEDQKRVHPQGPWRRVSTVVEK